MNGNKAAVIDIGSNTIRLLIGSISKGIVERTFNTREVTRLGKDIVSKGILSVDSIALSIRTISKYKVICDEYGINNIIAIGTSALREASNTEEFIKLVKSVTGMDITVISGHKEADFTLTGLRAGLTNKPFDKSLAIVTDIGGGSTEIIVAEESGLKYSLPVGAVKLFELFIKNDPPSYYEISLLKRHVLSELGSAIESIKKRVGKRHLSLVSTGGTPTTLAAISLHMDSYDGNRLHGLPLTYSVIDRIYRDLISVPQTERMSIIGLDPGRADIIVPGTVILMSLMELLQVEWTTISDFGLMEGILYDSICRDTGLY